MRLWIVLGGASLLALVAYWDLLFFRYLPIDPELRLQRFLFAPADTAPAVVVALAGWLLFRRRERLAALPRCGGSPLATAGLIGASLAIAAWAHFTGAHDLLAVSLALQGFALGNLLWGAPGLRVLLLPLGFLLFALPLPPPLLNHVLFQLQLWTAELTGWLLYLLDIPAYVSAERIFREGDTFAIVEGCSGLRSIETLTMLAVLMADLFRRRGLHAVLLVVLAPFVAFAANGFRALFLMLNPLSETVAIHNAQGIAILLAGLVVLYGIDGLLARVLPHPPAPAAPPARRSGSWIRGRRAAVILGTLAALAALALWLPSWEAPAPDREPLRVRLPGALGGWEEARELETDRVFLGRVGFAEQVARRYVRNGAEVDVFVGRADPGERLQAALSPKTERPGSGWMEQEAGTTILPVGPGGRGREVDQRVYRYGRRRVLVYHWREGLGGLARESGRALLALDSSPYQRAGERLVVRLTTALGEATQEERRRADRRLRELAEAVHHALSPAPAPQGAKERVGGKDFPVLAQRGKEFP